MAVIQADDLTRAALLGAFDPRALFDQEAKDGPARLRRLAAAATEVQVGERWLWTLTPDARREGLALLPKGKAARDILRGLPPSDGDPLAAALAKVLAGGRAPSVVARSRRAAARGEDLPELLQLLQALEMLRSAGVALSGWAAAPDITRRLSRVTVQADKAVASEQILPRKLHGRGKQLAAFLEFARTGQAPIPPFEPPKKPSPPGPSAPPTVVLSGLGGAGKSTLMEALRRRLAKDRALLSVTFDLDEAALRAGHRVALTQELLRQIGEERPALDARLSALRNSLRGAIAQMTEGIDPSREASAVISALTDLNAILLEETKGAPTPLVLIFDTFEEALALGEGRVRLIADWIGLIGQQSLSPRVILSGREAASLADAPLPGLALQGSILLGDLGVRAGRALLRDRFQATGVDALGTVPDLVAAFGSDPLTLMILARFAASIGKTGAALGADLTALAHDEGSEVRAQLDGEMRQTFLFSRILNRLPAENLKALASPGLVLRQVTPRLIREVLAGPCGLPEPMTEAEAEALFKDLAKMAWLVKPPTGAVQMVEHVPALRRRMLPQVMKDARAKAVAAAAAEWYQARADEGDAVAGLEAVYYRALGDPSALPDDPAVLRALADHLGPAMADLTFAQDRVREAQGNVISHAAVERLQDEGVRKRAREKRRKYQLSEGLESAVVAEAAGAEPPGAEPMTGDLVSARFAALELAAVAAEAPRLARELLDGFGQTNMVPTDAASPDDRQGLSVAALQAATACLSPEAGADARAALRETVQEWLADPARREALLAGYGNALQQSPQSWPAVLAAALVLSLADDRILSGLGGAVAHPLRDMAKVSHSPYAWRALRMLGPLPEGAEVKGIALAYLAPEVLPVLAESLSGSGSGPVRDAFDAIRRGSKVSVSDHNRIDTALFREDVAFRDVVPTLGRHPMTVPGRLPEFHGAFRVLFGTGAVTAAMATEAVESLARFVPWWPRELRAGAFGQAPFSPTLVSTLIDTADRCGRLPDLATALARAGNAPQACQRLAALIDATVAHYRAAAFPS